MKFTSTSGANVVINPAPFKDAIALKSAFASEFAKGNVNFDFAKFQKVFSDNKTKITDKEVDLNEVIKIFCLFDSSEQIYKALFNCLVRCTYNNEKITEATFDDEKARQDYYEILAACTKENIAPFFKGLASKLSGIVKQVAGNIQKSK